jgi:hypothetical protein
MWFFSTYVYKSKSGQKYWLHVNDKGKIRLYYFSRDQSGALSSIPRGYEVVENSRTSLPFLKKIKEKKKS